jgi:DNA-binding CsgD family transcriptional regulator
MKKYLFSAAAALPLAVLSGCGASPVAHGAPAIYCVAAVCALILLLACFAVTRGKDLRLLAVFSCIALVNCSYLALALARSVEEALWANRAAYLGSVFLLPAMLSVIMAVTEVPKKPWLFPTLLTVGAVIFFITASPGWLELYYRSVTLETINSATVLRKVYGPLHRLYTVYLMGYFAAMIGLILRATRKKTAGSGSHAVFLGLAVFVNIGVWLLEQVVKSEFELLAVSYIISELFLLGLYLLVAEQKRHLESAVAEAAEQAAAKAAQAAARSAQSSPAPVPVSAAMSEAFLAGLEQLTPTERAIYELYLEGRSTKEIMAQLGIKENTLKFHNKNLYAKLEVTSRKQLVQVAASVRAQGEVSL